MDYLVNWCQSLNDKFYKEDHFQFGKMMMTNDLNQNHAQNLKMIKNMWRGVYDKTVYLSLWEPRTGSMVACD